MVNIFSFLFQFSVQAYDDYKKVSTPSAIVTIYVTRNLNAPRFVETTYQAEIMNKQLVNSFVFDANATDLDTNVSQVGVFQSSVFT